VSSTFVDAHCHVDQCRGPSDAVRRAVQSNVAVVAVTESPSGYLRAKSALGGRSMVRIALGLHPMALPSLGRSAVGQFLGALPGTDYVGEVGLDYSTSDAGLRREQTRVFEEILAAPSARSSLWSVHSRRAAAETIERLEAARVPAILHWFTGSKALAERAVAAGLYFSVNLAMTESDRGRSLVAALPRERVLTETDAPFVSSGRQEPTDVIAVVDRLARTWSLGREEARDVLFENMARAFALRTPRASE
jgi:TatD DNase family protein